MKKRLSILIALILGLNACAFALNGANYPSWSGEDLPDHHLGGKLNDEMILLEFDSSQEYSNLADGLIQACFFAFDESQNHYLELYLKLPEDAAAGDRFTATDLSEAASITLYEISNSDEDFYFASQVLGIPYPSGSSYEIQIQQAEKSDAGISMRGTLNARLVRMNGTQSADESLMLSGVRFHFMLPLGASAASPTQTPAIDPLPTQTPQAPEGSSAPSLQTPLPTMDPHPAFTLPPDYRIL